MKEQFNKEWATVEIFKSVCIRNSSYNASEQIDSLWKRAKEMAEELYKSIPSPKEDSIN